MKKVYIYCLKCPAGSIRYIGKTINPKKRLSSHIYEAKTLENKRYVHNWINQVLREGNKPSLDIIEECTEDNWQKREKYWIEYYRNRIDNLCNICDGGLGGTFEKNYSDEELQIRAEKMSQVMSKFSEDTKKEIWELVQEDKSLEEIQEIYPEYSRHMDFGVRNGRQWNHITDIPKTKGIPKRKGYTFNRGLYIVRKTINGKRKTIFSSRNEEEVINYLNTT